MLSESGFEFSFGHTNVLVSASFTFYTIDKVGRVASLVLLVAGGEMRASSVRPNYCFFSCVYASNAFSAGAISGACEVRRVVVGGGGPSFVGLGKHVGSKMCTDLCLCVVSNPLRNAIPLDWIKPNGRGPALIQTNRGLPDL